MRVLDDGWFAQFAEDPQLHTALKVLAGQGWNIIHAPGITGHGTALADGLFHMTRPAVQLDRRSSMRNILTRAELVAFAFGTEHARSPILCASAANPMPGDPMPTDPLDVIDWHAPAAPPARPSRGNSAFLACMVLLGLCLAVLAWVGALEVIDNTLTLYRSLQP